MRCTYIGIIQTMICEGFMVWCIKPEQRRGQNNSDSCSEAFLFLYYWGYDNNTNWNNENHSRASTHWFTYHGRHTKGSLLDTVLQFLEKLAPGACQNYWNNRSPEPADPKYMLSKSYKVKLTYGEEACVLANSEDLCGSKTK